MWSWTSNGMNLTQRDIDGDSGKMGWSQTPPPLDVHNHHRDRDRDRDPGQRSSTHNLRSAFRATLSPSGTIRAVTPEPPPTEPTSASAVSDSFELASQQSSPRSIPGGPARRQGIVFEDSPVGESGESNSSSPTTSSAPARSQRDSGSRSFRPRTRTMDTSMMAQRSAPPSVTTEHRHRVGSVSSSGSQHVNEDSRAPPFNIEAVAFSSMNTAMGMSMGMGMGMGMASAKPSEPTSHPAFAKENKKNNSKRLMKRKASRPTSPLISGPPCIDSLPLPLPTDDANNVILLMKTLCGRMRGEIEYQGESGGPWHTGVAYIEDDKGCLMFDSGQSGPFHIPIVQDLRGCRVLPVDYPEAKNECLELVCTNASVEILICPTVQEEFDLWLAALLCWQQMRPTSVKLTQSKPSASVGGARPELKRHGTSHESAKTSSIIKVGKVMLWDKGLAISPRAVIKRPSTRDLKSPMSSWRRVSCILQDNGEFKLLTENDVSVLSVIELPQLSRCAIQQLDRTVLDEDHCIAVFPIYASQSTHLSVFRPVYLAFDTRVHFEVWFVLLRAFAVPDIYRLVGTSEKELLEITNIEMQNEGEIFRLEKTINVRVTEAKLREKTISESSISERPERPERPERQEKYHHLHHHHSYKGEQRNTTYGNYLAEVILDGEVRARTTTKTGTKNPYWREDCEFIELPPSLPLLSVILKKVEGNLDSSSNLLQASVGLPRTGNMLESICGAVDIPFDQPGKCRDSEQWLPILDEKQQSIGSMLIKVTHEEHVVLLAKEYAAISEMLHRFPSGLTLQIASVLPGQSRRLAELFLNIFQVSGSAGEWLMALVEDEIDGIGSQATIKKYRFSNRLKSSDSGDGLGDRELIVRDMGKSLAGEANLLFRGNSLLTQSLEFHMRRLGKEYLEDILQDKIFEINEINPDCEVDPSKVPHGADLEQHWSHLLQVTTDIWQCIANSANKLPPELRHILKYIRAVAEDRYGDFLRTVTYTSVSGFLFLRFICPAILSPKLFGLLRDHPRPRAQRTFTLIAKALQKLANLSNFGKREEWMEPMNRFLNVQRQSIRDFIDEVCDIPAEQGTHMVPASYSTPITILGRLSPTAKEGFPSLPYLIDSSRNLAALVKLWVDARPIKNHKGQVEGDLMLFNDICYGLQERADACLARVENVRAQEANYATADDLAESIEQATLIESLSLSATYADYSGSWSEVTERTADSSGSDGAIEDGMQCSSSQHRHRVRRHSSKDKNSREARKALRAASGHHSLKGKNAKVGRSLLNGIMRISGRGESPESKSGTSSK